MNRYSLLRLDRPFITWILYYNNTRIQAKLSGHSPVEYRQMAT
ncbi:IS3 family transposase [Weissella confusa]